MRAWLRWWVVSCWRPCLSSSSAIKRALVAGMEGL